ncbi:hypothetical protein EDC01DRAFT_776951 [Geopyxis carbonaria]|nr:hypothetical protein EDC01DRAFT_776951 [Geopyxis carbonaria]
MNIYKRMTARPKKATRNLTGLAKLRYILLGPLNPLVHLLREITRVTTLTTSAHMHAAPDSTPYAYHLLLELEDARIHYHETFAHLLIQRNLVMEDAARGVVRDIQGGERGYWPLPALPEEAGWRVRKDMGRLVKIGEALKVLDEKVEDIMGRWEVDIDVREEEEGDGLREWWDGGMAEQGGEGRARTG